jgi:hypothetical protein
LEVLLKVLARADFCNFPQENDAAAWNGYRWDSSRENGILTEKNGEEMEKAPWLPNNPQPWRSKERL